MYAPPSGSWVDNQLEWVVFRKRGPFHRCFWSIGFAFPPSLRDVNRVLRGRGGGGGRSPLCDKQLLFVRGSLSSLHSQSLVSWWWWSRRDAQLSAP